MRQLHIVSAIMCASALVGTSASAQTPSIEELVRKIDALQRRLDEVEGKAAKKPAAKPQHAAKPKDAEPQPVPVPVVATYGAPMATLLPPEPMGSPFEDALRSDLPGLSFRVPGASTEIRIYGFAKASGYHDFNGRNQTHTPSVQSIPLVNSPADFQGGDTSMTARFSRLGLDTRTATRLGTLETRIEGDFAGGPAASNNLVFRLRQAWGELGTESFRVLVGQANSLWNEGMFETLNDSTNLNQSFVRQTQLRFTSLLAPGLTGQVSIEAPDTQYTSAAGVFVPDTNFNGGASPAFTSVPDLLGRLTYRRNGFEFDTRGLLRQLTIRTAGTAAAPPAVRENTVGWGVASHIRIPMRWFSESFGADQLVGMAYTGEGIGRYFGGNSAGQDLLSNLGLPNANIAYEQNALQTYGVTAAYRRFWTPQLRSTFAYSYARQDYPAYALQFTPGTFPATSLNSEMQQGIVNLIWSPFAVARDGVVDTGWLDAGFEYIYSKRDVFGGSAATGTAGLGYGVANRFMGAAIVRF
jgi:hypothetical protein